MFYDHFSARSLLAKLGRCRNISSTRNPELLDPDVHFDPTEEGFKLIKGDYIVQIDLVECL